MPGKFSLTLKFYFIHFTEAHIHIYLQYDSGGALYYKTKRSFVAAIISYGSGCAQDAPSVNTRVISYLNWILTNTPGAQYCNLVF